MTHKESLQLKPGDMIKCINPEDTGSWPRPLRRNKKYKVEFIVNWPGFGSIFIYGFDVAFAAERFEKV